MHEEEDYEMETSAAVKRFLLYATTHQKIQNMVELYVGTYPAIQDVLDVCPYITDEENEEKEWEKK